MSESAKSVLLVGASRGLGLAIAEEYIRLGWSVVATERSGSTGLRELSKRSGGRLEIETLDITSPHQVMTLRSRLAARCFDLLFVNAGVTNAENETAAQVSTLEFERLMVTNALSPIRVLEAFRDLVAESGTLGVMSSGQGSVANNLDVALRWEVYRASKVALNSLMRSFRARLADDPRTMLLMAPGWVRTDMGGAKARLSIEESIPRLVATMEAQASKGGLQFLDYTGAVVPW